jgi:hypothetical protein
MTDTPWLTLAEAVTYSRSGERTLRAAATEYRRSGGKRGLRHAQRDVNCKLLFHRDDLDSWLCGSAPARGARRLAPVRSA